MCNDAIMAQTEPRKYKVGVYWCDQSYGMSSLRTNLRTSRYNETDEIY